MWDFDSQDSNGATPAESKALYDTLLAKNPNNILTLNHETHQGTITEVMPYVIKKLKAAGYKMVTVAECLGNPSPAYSKISSPQPGTYSCSDLTIPTTPTNPTPPSSGSVRIHPNGDTNWCVVAQSNSNNAAVVLYVRDSSTSLIVTNLYVSGKNAAALLPNGPFLVETLPSPPTTVHTALTQEVVRVHLSCCHHF